MKELLQAKLLVERRIVAEDREPTPAENEALTHIKEAIRLLEAR